ncbi:MAG: type II toxin-antitoxin system VapC family toxin [Nitriliruptoraceae bacterium]
MIAYFDTSALIPLLVDEPGSERACRLWDVADNVVAVRLIYAEARAALAQATRLGRLAATDLATTVDALDGLYANLDLLEIDERLVRRAGELAQHHALRGYDAVHLAAAERLRDDATVMVAGDRDLCTAARTLGMAVADTSAEDDGE